MHRIIRSLGTCVSWTIITAGLGCASAPMDEAGSTGPVELMLTGQGSELRLEGSPIDPAYRASYPNPTQVSMMLVRVNDSGDVEESCPDAKPEDCADSPFFARIMKAGGGSALARVFDMYGTAVADVPVAKTDAPATGGSSDPDFKIPALGAKTRPEGGTNSGGNASGGGLGAMCPADTTAMKAKFCEVANRELQERNIAFRLKCEDLSSNLLDLGKLMSASTPKGDTPIRRCREIWQPAQQETRAMYGMCPLIMNWVSEARNQLRAGAVCKSSPLVVDLNGDGISMTSAEQGVVFDLLGAGQPVRNGWLSGSDDALLVLDRNGNGHIDGGEELFGDVTDGRTFAHGFAALAELDLNKDGLVDAKDPAFHQLRLWHDRDKDAKSSQRELSTLASADVAAISVTDVVESSFMDRHGNEVPLRSHFIRSDGKKGFVGDVLFRFGPASTDGENVEAQRELLSEVVGPALWLP